MLKMLDMWDMLRSATGDNLLTLALLFRSSAVRSSSRLAAKPSYGCLSRHMIRTIVAIFAE